MDPMFWLGLSLLLVAVSIAAVLLSAIPAMQELGRAAKGAEKLFDTLNRELPPTLEAIRLTSLEFTELTDDLTGGAQGASNIVQQVDDSVSGVKDQAQQVTVTTKSVVAGFKAAWQTFTAEETAARDPNPTVPEPKNLPESQQPPMPAAPPKPDAVQSRLAGYEGNRHEGNRHEGNGHEGNGHANLEAEKLILPMKKPIERSIPTED
jgi:uncharacterized protein YoxC